MLRKSKEAAAILLLTVHCQVTHYDKRTVEYVTYQQ